MKKKAKVSKYGQWKYPGEDTIIPNANGSITMQGVPYPVFGIDDLGNQQMMMPGNDYQFPGNSVYEIPMMAYGGALPKAQSIGEILYVNSENDPAYKAYNDSLNLYNESMRPRLTSRKSFGEYGSYGLRGRNVTDVPLPENYIVPGPIQPIGQRITRGYYPDYLIMSHPPKPAGKDYRKKTHDIYKEPTRKVVVDESKAVTKNQKQNPQPAAKPNYNKPNYNIKSTGDAAIDRLNQQLYGPDGLFKLAYGGDISVPDLRRVTIKALPKAQSVGELKEQALQRDWNRQQAKAWDPNELNGAQEVPLEKGTPVVIKPMTIAPPAKNAPKKSKEQIANEAAKKTNKKAQADATAWLAEHPDYMLDADGNPVLRSMMEQNAPAEFLTENQKALKEEFIKERNADPLQQSLGSIADNPQTNAAAERYANTQLAEDILKKNPRDSHSTRAEWIESLTPQERAIIQSSNKAYELDPSMATKFARALQTEGNKNSQWQRNLDLTEEEKKAPVSRMDLMAPLTYPTNLLTGALTGDFNDAFHGRTPKPYFGDNGSMRDYYQPEAQSIGNMLWQGALDPLNGIGIGLVEDLGLAGATSKLLNNASEGARGFYRGAAGLYNDIAEGDNLFKYAWQSPASRFDNDAKHSDIFYRMNRPDMPKSNILSEKLKNITPLTTEDKVILKTYDNSSGHFKPKLSELSETSKPYAEKLDKVLEKSVLESDEPFVLSRRINAGKDSWPGRERHNLILDENGIYKPERPLSFSIGRDAVGNSKYESGADRIVVKYDKGKHNLLKNDYPAITPEEYIAHSPDFAGKNFEDVPSNIVEDMPNGLLHRRTGEREVLTPRDTEFKFLHKVKNKIGGYDYIMEPIHARNSETLSRAGATSETLSAADETTNWGATRGKDFVKSEHKDLADTIDQLREDRIKFWETPKGKARLEAVIENTPELKAGGLTVDDYIASMRSMTNENRTAVNQLTKADEILAAQEKLIDDFENMKFLEQQTGMQSPNGMTEQYVQDELTKLQKQLDDLKIDFENLSVNSKYVDNAFMNRKGAININIGKSRNPTNVPNPYTKFTTGVGQYFTVADARRVIQHELGHLVQRGVVTNLDKELKGLELLKNESGNLFSSAKGSSPDTQAYDAIFNKSNEYFKRARKYFNTGGKGQEKLPFLEEVRADMLERGIIKNLGDDITEGMIRQHYANYMMEAQGGKYPLRLYDIMKNNPKNFSILKSVMNKMPVAVVGAGVGYGVMGGDEEEQPALPQKKRGGGIKNVDFIASRNKTMLESLPKAQTLGTFKTKPLTQAKLNIPAEFQDNTHLDAWIGMPQQSGWGDFTTHRVPSVYDAIKSGDPNNMEEAVNKYLGHPQERAIALSEQMGNPGEDPIDNVRHSTAAMYTQQAIKDKIGIPIVGDAVGWLGANTMGIGHELGTIFSDERPWDSKLREAGEDIFNNAIGSTLGLLPGTQEQKGNALYNLSVGNWLPDGVVDPNGQNNLYFKDEQGNTPRLSSQKMYDNIFRKKHGGTTKRVTIKSLPKNWKTQ